MLCSSSQLLSVSLRSLVASRERYIAEKTHLGDKKRFKGKRNPNEACTDHDDKARLSSLPASTQKNQQDLFKILDAHWDQLFGGLPNASTASQLSPLRLDDYIKIMQIGQGAYGDVWLADDLKHNRLVALKKLKFGEEREGFSKNGIREISLLRTLKHPNIVEFYGVAGSQSQGSSEGPLWCSASQTSRKLKPKEDLPPLKNFDASLPMVKGSMWMVFEYLPFDLNGIVEMYKESHEYLEISEVKKIVYNILRALEFCHSRNVVHRDLKSANLLLSAEGHVKLADFGLARVIDARTIPLTSRVITFWYRPPELLLGVDWYTPSVDIWSTGCIFAELLLNKALFGADREATVLKAIADTFGAPSDTEWPDRKTLPLWNVPEANPLLKMSALEPSVTSIQETLHRSGSPPGQPVPCGLQDSHELGAREHHVVWKKLVERLGPLGLDLLKRMFRYDPKSRISAVNALTHPWLVSPDLLKGVSLKHSAQTYCHAYAFRKDRERQKHKAFGSNGSAKPHMRRIRMLSNLEFLKRINHPYPSGITPSEGNAEEASLPAKGPTPFTAFLTQPCAVEILEPRTLENPPTKTSLQPRAPNEDGTFSIKHKPPIPSTPGHPFSSLKLHSNAVIHTECGEQTLLQPQSRGRAFIPPPPTTACRASSYVPRHGAALQGPSGQLSSRWDAQVPLVPPINRTFHASVSPCMADHASQGASRDRGRLSDSPVKRGVTTCVRPRGAVAFESSRPLESPEKSSHLPASALGICHTKGLITQECTRKKQVSGHALDESMDIEQEEDEASGFRPPEPPTASTTPPTSPPPPLHERDPVVHQELTRTATEPNASQPLTALSSHPSKESHLHRHAFQAGPEPIHTHSKHERSVSPGQIVEPPSISRKDSWTGGAHQEHSNTSLGDGHRRSFYSSLSPVHRQTPQGQKRCPSNTLYHRRSSRDRQGPQSPFRTSQLRHGTFPPAFHRAATLTSAPHYYRDDAQSSQTSAATSGNQRSTHHWLKRHSGSLYRPISHHSTSYHKRSIDPSYFSRDDAYPAQRNFPYDRSSPHHRYASHHPSHQTPYDPPGQSTHPLDLGKTENSPRIPSTSISRHAEPSQPSSYNHSNTSWTSPPHDTSTPGRTALPPHLNSRQTPLH